MNVIKGSDLVDLFGALNGLEEWSRFAGIRSATEQALSQPSVDAVVLSDLLHRWMALTVPRSGLRHGREESAAIGAVDPNATNSGTPTTRA